MTPFAWSHSALDDFVNCPRAFHQKRVLKRFPYEESEQMKWGNHVHKAFELRVADGTPLPVDLTNYEPLMARFADMPGEVYAERQIALNKKGEPCSWRYPTVWYRGVIDYTNIQPEKGRALIVDYKTGKPHNKFKQLISNAIHTFSLYPEVENVKVAFFWTKTDTLTTKEYTREEIPAMWSQLLPDLKQYKEAFQSDTWQPRPSGLCNGWCPVTDCEFWKPKRVRN